MKLVVGIGNPGEKYENTRHNVGFMVLDKLLSKIQNENLKFKSEKKFNAGILRVGDIILAKPTTYMNESGIAVSSLFSYFNIHNSNLYVIHDDLDLHLGEYKIQKGIGPKLHYGIQSINKALGTNDYWRVRVGVDNRRKMENGTWQMESFTKGEDYVLQDFSKEEVEVIEGVIENIASDMVNLVNK